MRAEILEQELFFFLLFCDSAWKIFQGFFKGIQKHLLSPATLAQDGSCLAAGAQPSAQGPGVSAQADTAFLFSGSNGSKDEHLSQRQPCTCTHTELP